MTSKPENPLAFPRPYSEANTEIRANPIHQEDGMTLRDYFAGQALVGLVSKSPYQFTSDPMENVETYEMILIQRKAITNASYSYADAMLAAREDNNDKN